MRIVNGQHRYRVSLYGADADPERDAPLQVRTEKGVKPPAIYVDGFTRMLEIALEDHWRRMASEGLTRYQVPVRTYETFVKFGVVTQSIRDYLVVLQIQCRRGSARE